MGMAKMQLYQLRSVTWGFSMLWLVCLVEVRHDMLLVW